MSKDVVIIRDNEVLNNPDTTVLFLDVIEGVPERAGVADIEDTKELLRRATKYEVWWVARDAADWLARTGI